jgi:hypothetical protein
MIAKGGRMEARSATKSAVTGKQASDRETAGPSPLRAAGDARLEGHPRIERLARLGATVNGGPRPAQLKALGEKLDHRAADRAPASSRGRANATGLPDPLKAGVEALSGIALDDVRVHYGSAEPARLQAHAFTRGTDIHVAPGQERHLPHEAWHVVQQAQGRVKPTMQMKGGVAVNDDSGLELEADAMGARALASAARLTSEPSAGGGGKTAAVSSADAVVQRTAWEWAGGAWTPLSPTAREAPIFDGEDGEIYDDVLDQRFATRALYDAKDHYTELKKGHALDEDSDGEAYLPSDSESDQDEDSGDEEEDSLRSPSPSAPSAYVGPASAPLTAAERIQQRDKARAEPFASSALTGPTGRFETEDDVVHEKFDSTKPRKAGKRKHPVTITSEKVGMWTSASGEKETRRRPSRVQGIVEPTETKGRPKAPDADSGVQIYSGGGARPSSSIKVLRNNGLVDAARGHLMALELGGPNVPANIAPQWAQFQGSGEWREMEKRVLEEAKALPETEKLHFDVEVFYKDTGETTPSVNSFGFPTAFKVSITRVAAKTLKRLEEPRVVFDQGQAQNETDDKKADRVFKKADGADHDPEMDMEEPDSPDAGASAAKPGASAPKAKKARKSK